MSRKHLSPEEYKSLLEYLEHPFNIDTETMVVDLLMRTGMRQGELVNLRRCDFDHKRFSIRISALKGSNSRTARLAPEIWLRVHPLINSIGPWDGATLGTALSESSAALTQTRQVQRMAHRVLSKALGPGHGYTTHHLRHTYALRCLEYFGNDLLKVKIAMGHKSLATTARYLDYLQSEDIAEDIIDAVG